MTSFMEFMPEAISRAIVCSRASLGTSYIIQSHYLAPQPLTRVRFAEHLDSSHEEYSVTWVAPAIKYGTQIMFSA